MIVPEQFIDVCTGKGWLLIVTFVPNFCGNFGLFEFTGFYADMNIFRLWFCLNFDVFSFFKEFCLNLDMFWLVFLDAILSQFWSNLTYLLSFLKNVVSNLTCFNLFFVQFCLNSAVFCSVFWRMLSQFWRILLSFFWRILSQFWRILQFFNNLSTILVSQVSLVTIWVLRMYLCDFWLV